MIKTLKLSAIAAATLAFVACDKDSTDKVEQPVGTPATYEFMREGSTSVSYSGQTDRLNQLGEMKAMLNDADAGNVIQEADLLDMFENANGNGNGNFSFTSTKQLKSKTFDLDQTYFENILKAAAATSVDGNNGAMAADGTAGLITRDNGKTILVDENGFEFTQIFEKGLMGATFMHQIVNTYLTDDKIGPTVDNETVEAGKNYTAMEHHWDEAFGYFGAPTDFSSDYTGSGSAKYWAKYANSSDALLGFNDALMNPFKKGRNAIVLNRHEVKNDQVALINAEFEKLAAAIAIHYANSAKSTTNQGDLLHVLSESYAFARALRFANPDYRMYTPQEIDTLLNDTFGGNLWTVTSSDLDTFINELSAKYGLDGVKDQL